MEEKHVLCVMLCFVDLVVFQHVTQAEEFIMACVQDRYSTSNTIESYSDEQESWVQIQASPREILTPFQSSLHYIRSELLVTTGIENKSVLVKTSDDSVFILLRNGYSMTSVLTISDLGTKYILSSCIPRYGDYSSVLVIATHSGKTDVSITFRLQGNVTYDNNTYSDGDELTVSLEEYQTLTIRSDFDLTRTVVNTTQTVALFIGVVDIDTDDMTSYVQLLPVHLYGQEHIVPALTGLCVDSFATYQLQIISEHNDTQIVFNDGYMFSVDKNRFYRQYLTLGKSIQFSSSKPVMALLCKHSYHWGGNGFVVLPPLTLYTNHTVIRVYRGRLTVLAENSETDLVVQTQSVSHIPRQWEDIPGTNFKVGTFTDYSDILSISSNRYFSTLVINNEFMYNGGYGFYNWRSDPGTNTVIKHGIIGDSTYTEALQIYKKEVFEWHLEVENIR